MRHRLIDFADEQLIEDALPAEAPRLDLLTALARHMDAVFAYVMGGGVSAGLAPLDLSAVETFPAGVRLIEGYVEDMLTRAHAARAKSNEARSKAVTAATRADRKKITDAAKARAKAKPAKLTPVELSRNLAAARRAAKSHPMDRHIARAANPTNTTIRRRGRAPSAGEPCVPGSTRHRFSKQGDCRVPGCSVQRAVSRVLADAATPAARQPELPTPARAPKLAGNHLHYCPNNQALSWCGVQCPDMASRCTDMKIVDCSDCKALLADSQKPPAAAPAAKPRKRMTIELPDGSTVQPSEDADV